MLRDLFRLFPAHAGVILVTSGPLCGYGTFPRTCGGDPNAKDAAPVWQDFSRTCGGDPYTDIPLKANEAFSPHTRG